MPCAFRSIVPASSRTTSIGDPLAEREVERRQSPGRRGAPRRPRRRDRRARSRARGGGPRSSRPPCARDPSTGSEDARRARAARRRPRRSEAATGARGRTASSRARARPSNATGTPTAANAVPSASLTASTDGQTTAISCGGVPALTWASTRLRDQLERAARTGSLEPAHRAVEQDASGRLGEQRALDVRERGRQELLGAWRKLDDGVAGERREIVDRPAERRVDGAAGLVGDRHVHLRARRERLEQAPLDAGEVLEAVREDRAVSPGPEIARQPLDGAAAKHAAVPSVDAVELARGTPPTSEASGSSRSPGSSKAPSSSASARPTASAKPAKRAPSVGAAGRRAFGRGRLARHHPRGAGLGPSPRARCSNSVSNVPIVPASRPPCRSSSSRSTRSTSARCGTISHGSRSSAATKRSRSVPTLPECAGPTTSDRLTRAA